MAIADPSSRQRWRHMVTRCSAGPLGFVIRTAQECNTYDGEPGRDSGRAQSSSFMMETATGSTEIDGKLLPPWRTSFGMPGRRAIASNRCPGWSRRDPPEACRHSSGSVRGRLCDPLRVDLSLVADPGPAGPLQLEAVECSRADQP